MIHSGTGAEHGDAIARAHAELAGRSEFQTSLPNFKPPETPHWLIALGEFLRHHWPAIKWALWALVALVLLFVAWSLIRAYWPAFAHRMRRPRPVSETQTSDWRPAPVAARRLLEESDALAAQGLYAEAVHLLLLRSIEDIEAQRPHLVRPTFTSREIGSLDALPQAARTVFAGIAHVVERALFACAPVDQSDFARCRKDYEAFAFPALWRTDGAR